MSQLAVTPFVHIGKLARHYRLSNQVAAYLFLLPALVIFLVFFWYPIITTIIYSFQTVSLTNPAEWIGLDNYVRMFGDPLFYTAWQNIGSFALLSIVFGFMVPIFLAMMINEVGRLGSIFQVITYIPSLIPIAIALLVWRLIYLPEGGILNSMLVAVGLPAQLWLQNPNIVRPALILITTWMGAGSSILIYLAALKEIHPEIYEAAELDGFSPWERIFYITLPLLQTRMSIMLVLQIIFVAQIFNEPFILTSGGPANNTITPVLQIYRTAFNNSDFGLASAWSVSMLVVLSIFSVLYVWFIRKNEANQKG
jgi:multiple sugar transport system permease protein